MSEYTQLYFLDFGLSNMKDGTLQGRIMTCDGQGAGLKPILEGVRTWPGMSRPSNRFFLQLNILN
jgi:hypothetical protein